MRCLPVVLLALLATFPALAAEAPWQQVAPGARLRLISSDVRGTDGTTLVGLELDMPQGFTTYWRSPGESGIPTVIDAGRSQGVSAAWIDWPIPTVEKAGGVLDYVYRGPTVLPITARLADDAPILDLSVTMGVCAEVCVPVKAHFALPLAFAAADPANAIRLRQAESQVPIPWDDTAPAVAALGYRQAEHALVLQGLDPSIDANSLIATTNDPGLVFDRPVEDAQGQGLTMALRGAAGDVSWAGKPVELTFMTPRGAYSATVPVRPLP